MSVECQVNIKSQSELDIGGRENCHLFLFKFQVKNHIFLSMKDYFSVAET